MIVNILANTVAEVKPETLGDKLRNVKALKLDEMLLSDYRGQASALTLVETLAKNRGRHTQGEVQA